MIIDCEGVVKTYGKVKALDGLNLRVAEGTVLGLLGPNGAGKTTTVRVLSTLAKPDSGRIEIGGHDVVREPHLVRRMFGLSGQYAAVDQYLTGRENLVLFARLYRMRKKVAIARADELIERFDLTEAADRLAKTYSGGMRRRLDLAASLIAKPRLIALDEPTTGLDPRSRLTTWELIGELVDGGTTVLLTTQYLEEADRLADRIVVIDSGKVIADGTADDLKAKAGSERIEVSLVDADDRVRAREILAAVGDSEPTADRHDHQLSVPVSAGAKALATAAAEFAAHGLAVHDLSLRRPTLDDVFLALTGHTTEVTS
ncbi:ATP-binding cassette domain-containing protein [Kibdelosporangium phytohabitans]|uniref:ABC transporter n=1 Tax=Kibdelosporangium phytohabitans TaxID=860235 RepID=A0A0N9I028_9PSEU|nr:ATP-binding cassette domain-containing protein [Kibdelosporangium phytohabitans]ALG10924.1 ABC transporter [Kibdelosporangium phytohabitans]MBE1462115.1 ABC-2 type transport system ATP-binding protein [Kibdelosporangium phytohabitans]